MLYYLAAKFKEFKMKIEPVNVNQYIEDLLDSLNVKELENCDFVFFNPNDGTLYDNMYDDPKSLGIILTYYPVYKPDGTYIGYFAGPKGFIMRI
jgi:hypothetical protein